jgi:heat shock protein HslJ
MDFGNLKESCTSVLINHDFKGFAQMASQSWLNLQIPCLLPVNKCLIPMIAISIALAGFLVSNEAHIAIAQGTTWKIAKKTSNYTQVMQELSGSNWKLNQWDNSAFNNEVSIDSVTIEFTKNQISGFGGCNRFSGTYNRQGDKLTISDLNYTMRGCETSIMRREESFLGAMAGIKKVRFLENQLLLEYKTNRGESGVLEFSKTNSPNLSVNTPNGNIFPHPSPGDDNLPLGNPGVSQ